MLFMRTMQKDPREEHIIKLLFQKMEKQSMRNTEKNISLKIMELKFLQNMIKKQEKQKKVLRELIDIQRNF